MAAVRVMITTVRALEAFLFVLVSAFLSQIAVTGEAINLAEPASQSRLLTAFLAAAGIAFRQYAATRGGTGTK
jgi:hypothetical protein